MEPLPSDVARLVRDTSPETEYATRLAAVRALSTIEASDVSIVRTLLAVKECDPSYQVRQEAAQAVRALVHSPVLAEHPELRAAVEAEVRHSAPTARAVATGGTAPALPAGEPAAERSPARPLIPWLTIWIWPRRTIRQIVDANPRYGFLLLILLGGWARGIDTSLSQNLGDTLSLGEILAQSAVLGPVVWGISVYVSAALLRWIGSMLGGQAESDEVRAALAWSTLPGIALLPVWAVFVALMGVEFFQSTTPSSYTNPLLYLAILGLALLTLLMSVWQIVLNVLTTAEVHGFSLWRSLATWAILTLIVLVPLVCLLLALSG